MLLKDSIKVLGKEFGFAKVAEEATAQHDIKRVQWLARDLAMGPRQKIARIRAARIIFNLGLKEAKELVEANFSDNGNGDPI